MKTFDEVARRVLKKNTTQEGILAGSTHFNDLWARDALYASWGAIDQGLLEGPRNTLHTLKKHIIQGQVPLRVGRKSMILAFLHLPTRKGAVYGNDKSKDPALDPNSLYLITLEKYLRVQQDKKLYDKKEIGELADWLLTWKNKKGLLTEGKYASWDDCLKKQSASIYNNALAYAALHSASRLTKRKQYAQEAQKLKEAINKELYKNNYYHAWEGMSVFDVPGNLLAILLGLADNKQTVQILKTLNSFKKKDCDEFPKTNYPAYPKTVVYKPFFLVGMSDYHNQGPYWSWVAALENLVQKNKALSKWLGDEIFEIYTGANKPTKRIFYESEKDFSWTAGLLLVKKIKK